MTDGNTEIVETMLSNGERILLEAIPLDGQSEIVFSTPSFKKFTDGVEAVAQEMINSLSKVRPRSANIELNFEIGVESGQLKALLVRGGGTASVRITLEYSEGVYREGDEDYRLGLEKRVVEEIGEGVEKATEGIERKRISGESEEG